MSKVRVFDGAASDTPSVDLAVGSDYRAFKYDYTNGKHDRYEREFLGFANVVQEELNTKGVHLSDGAANEAIFDSGIRTSIDSAKVYRQVTQTYLNNSFYTKGLLVNNETKGLDSKNSELVIYRKTENDYVARVLNENNNSKKIEISELSDATLILKDFGELGATVFPFLEVERGRPEWHFSVLKYSPYNYIM